MKNKEVRGILCNIPNINAFITKRTAAYIGKITRSGEDSLPKKFLAAWISGSQKNGVPQLMCNNNFAEVISKILTPDKSITSKTTPLKESLLLAKDESNWQVYIDNYCETYHKTDSHEEPPYESSDDDEADYVVLCILSPRPSLS
jgi:hypothetical protein